MGGSFFISIFYEKTAKTRIILENFEYLTKIIEFSVIREVFRKISDYFFINF